MGRLPSSNAGAAGNIVSSPPSGSDHTHYNTPSTNITAMSPMGHSNAPAPKLNLREIEMSGRLTGGEKHQDERLGLPATSELVSLSPTAEEFTPGIGNASLGPKQDVGTPYASLHPQANARNSPFGIIGQAIPTRTIVNDVFKEQYVLLNSNTLLAIGQFSNEDNTARVFEISGVTNPDALAIAASFPIQDFKSLIQIDSSEMHRGVFRMVFSSIRDARQAFIRAAYTAFPRCKLTFLSPKTFAATRGQNPTNVSDHAGQLRVVVASRHHAMEITVAEFYNVLSQVGEVYALHSLESPGNGCLAFRVEYCDIRDAENAIGYLNAADLPDIHVRATPYNPDVKAGTTSFVPYSTIEERLSLTGRSTVPSGNLLEAEALMARLIAEAPASARNFGRSGHNQVDVIRIQEGVDVRTTIMLRNIPNKVTQADLKNFLDNTSLGAYDFMYLRIDFANNCNVGYAFINFIDPLAIVPFAQARAGAKWNIHDSNKVAEISYATIQGRDCLIQKFRNSSVMLEHPSFRPKLYFAGNNAMAGQEERFPEPDNFSKMRRSIENAEHIGLFRPSLGGHKMALSPAKLRQGSPLPPQLTSMTSSHSLTDSMVDIDHPNDPFAGSAGRQSSALARYTPTSSPELPGLFAPREGQQHREEQRRRRSQFDRGTPGAEYEASAHRLLDPALEDNRRAYGSQPRFTQAFGHGF